MEINFRDFLFLLVRKIPFLILSVAIGAGIFFGYTKFSQKPKYDCEITMIVNADPDSALTTGNIKASQDLVKSYIAIMKDYSFAEKIKSRLPEPDKYSTSRIRSSISAKAVSDSPILDINIITGSSSDSYYIANIIEDIAPTLLRSYFDNTGSIKILREAIKPAAAVKNNFFSNAVIGGLVGLVLAVFIILLREKLDTRIKCEEDIIECTGLPILGSISCIE